MQPQLSFEIENELRPVLIDNERLLWTGRPKTGILFRLSDIYLIPFSLLWFGFAIFWVYTASRSPAGLFALFGVPFIIIGFYISIGRFFTDAIKRKNTLYGITDNRIIIRSGIFRREVKSWNIRSLSGLSFKEKSDGTGTISLGQVDNRYTLFRGMESWPGVTSEPCLEFIDEVRKVYNVIVEVQRRN